MFEQGDKVVYPGYGVAVVEDIMERTVGGSVVHFFKLTFLFKDMTILVPSYNVENLGIRYPSDSTTVDAAIKELQNKPERKLESIDFTPSGWNRRQKNYQLKIQSGILLEIVKIYRDLMYVAKQKELSFGERTLLQSTEELILQEVQLVRDEDKTAVVKELRSPFRNMFMEAPDSLYAQEQTSPTL